MHEIYEFFPEQVEAKMKDNSSGTLAQLNFKDQVQRLLVIPQDHILTLPRKKLRRFARKLEEGDSKLLEHFGRELQIDEDDLDDFCVSLRFWTITVCA